VRSWPRLWLVLVATAPLALAVGRLLPAEGLGLALRLTGAAACVLVLPGAFVVRALGAPVSVGVALAAALAWSLVAVFTAMAVTFAVSGTLGLTLGLLAGTMLAAFVLALREQPSPLARGDVASALGLLGGGVGLAAALWWATGTIGGSLGPTVSDALFHLAAVRKLDDAGTLSSIDVVAQLSGGDVHPGYAFPLWHGALALIARVAGVDPTLVLLYLPPILTPLAVLIAYGAGMALFRSWAGGVAAAAAQVALVGFARDGVGLFQFLSQPGGTARYLLVPGVLALVFAFVAEGGRRLLASVAAAAFVLAVVHPTYMAFVALALVGFLLARALVSDGVELRRLLAGLAAACVPAGLFLAWLVQFAGTGSRQELPVRFGQQVEAVASGLQLRPEQMAWGGGVKVAALAAVPLALLAGGRRWSSYVLGATVAIALAALVPPLFERLADAVSLAQAVRLAGFLPLPFALAGAAALAGRARLAGVAGALAAGIGVELAYHEPATGAGWVVWVAAVGAACGLVAWIVRRPSLLDDRSPGAWTMAAAVAFAVPIAVTGFRGLARWDDPDPYALTPGLTEALRDDARPLDVVLAPSVTSYRIAAYAPVRVVLVPPGHAALLAEDDYRSRERSAELFFFAPATTPAERAAVLRRYDVDWVVVDESRGQPRLPAGLALEYRDARYAFYRVTRRQEPA
jgi:hypothetical protein